MDSPDALTRDERLADLKRRLQRGVSAAPRSENRNPTSFWQPGTIGEWLSPAAGSGATTLAWRTLAESLPDQGICTIVDSGGTCCAPAIAGWGIDLHRLLVIRPKKPQEAWWVAEQSLRSRGVAATCVWTERVPERTLRRWQLAAEIGGGVGVIFRPAEACREPSWAEFRVLVTAIATSGEARRVRLDLLYRRGGTQGSAQMWELDRAEGHLHMVSPLAHPAASRSAAGA